KIPYLFDKLTIELFDLLFFRLDNNNQFYESFYFQSFLSELLKTYNTKFNIDLNQDNKRILFPNLFSDTKNLNLTPEEISMYIQILDNNATNLKQTTVYYTYNRISSTKEIRETDYGNYLKYNNLYEILFDLIG
ncbi:hypothetical protein AAT99_14770, partial [Listeria monocytogenes]|nr:hypothetical protein [Listeria monocytogenes]